MDFLADLVAVAVDLVEVVDGLSGAVLVFVDQRSEEHTSELQSPT